MAESKMEPSDTSHVLSQDDGEIPGKLPKASNNKDAAEPLCDTEAVQSDDEDYRKAHIPCGDNFKMCTCMLCDPCGEDGTNLKAEGYCVDCNNFLCIDCFRIHIKPKPMRHHVLQDKESMPHTKLTTSKESQKELCCPTHQGQTVLSYCNTHDSVLCKLCQQFDHRQCKKHGNVIDLNDDVLDTNQITDIQCQIEALRKDLKHNKTISTQTSDNIKVSYARIVEEITAIKDSDLQMTEDISATCENMLLELVSMGADLKRVSETGDKLQLFLKLKKTQALIKTFKCKLIQVIIDNKNFEYVFISENQDNSNFGKFGSLMKCQIITETETIHMRTESDATDCHISGIARLSENMYAIADYNNKQVKLVDLTCKKVALDLQLDVAPYDVTSIDEKNIAITTLYQNTIKLISITDTMKVFKTISRCHVTKGITHINDNLFVCCGNPNGIQIHTLDGVFKHAVSDKDDHGVARFADVRYISQGVDTNTLYLTEGRTNKVTSMTSVGKVLASFTHEDLVNPRGITCSRDGRIFVCSYDSHMIFELSSDLSQGQVILGEEKGIFKPFSIFFSEEKQRLLVGSHGKNDIQMFQV